MSEPHGDQRKAEIIQMLNSLTERTKTTPPKPKLDHEICIQIAARIWCDPEFEHITMDIEAAQDISDILYMTAHSQGK